MSRPIHPRGARRARLAVLGAGLALTALPGIAQAAPVGLGTASPFAVLGGTTVTNTGPSVLNGNLGVSPGTALTGFGLPAVVNGSTHANDAVAAQAQADLTTAYDVAAGQPVAPADDLSGTDLGNRSLRAGAYRFSSSAQLTGVLTLDAEGDPNAQFVFEIASTLTTASASSVRLVNGASPCNVFWQVGSSATLGTTTAFQGTVLALSSITLNTGATVLGRMLARNGQVSLDDNVVNVPGCAAGTAGSAGSAATPGASSPGAAVPTATSGATRPRRGGTATLQRTPRSPGTRRPTCTDGFSATVRGRQIRRVVFRLDGRRVAGRGTSSPFRVFVKAAPGRHEVTARVTFKDGTPARTLSLGYRACAVAALAPRRGPSRFAG